MLCDRSITFVLLVTSVLCDDTVCRECLKDYSSTKKHANTVQISCKLNDTVFMMKIW